MSDDIPSEAPDLGEPTDTAVSDEAVVSIVEGDRPATSDADDNAERTLETPDNLGGTGGTQAGGAG